QCHPLVVRSLLFTTSAPPQISTLSLHDALPICCASPSATASSSPRAATRRRRSSSTSATPTSAGSTASSTVGRSRCSATSARWRSEEHTSELQSRENLVCRLLLEKKKITELPPS